MAGDMDRDVPGSGSGWNEVQYGGMTMREVSDMANSHAPTSSSGPVSSGGSAPRIGKSAPLWISLPIWGGLIWAFIHIPFMTHGHWSGPIGFGAITLALLITSSSLRAFALGCLVPFTLFGTFIVYQTIIHGRHPVYPSITMHHKHPVPAIKLKAHKRRSGR